MGNNIEDLKDEYIDHMMNPRNYGKIENYSAKGIGKNPNNNELVEMYIKVTQKILVDIKFLAIGCMSTIVTGSIFTDMIMGETIEEAESVMDDFVKGLETAPPETKACGEMVAKSFIAALVNLHNREAGRDEESYTLLITEDCITDEKE
jgi:nitrogen fixation NifU-like protein